MRLQNLQFVIGRGHWPLSLELRRVVLAAGMRLGVALVPALRVRAQDASTSAFQLVDKRNVFVMLADLPLWRKVSQELFRIQKVVFAQMLSD